MDRPFLRKPRSHFETAPQPSHLTFDDGVATRQNLPWMHFTAARWDYAEPDTVKVTVGDFLIVLTGQNLGPLFVAIEERTLLRVRAQPELAAESERDGDTIVTSIRFLPVPSVKPAARLPVQGDLRMA